MRPCGVAVKPQSAILVEATRIFGVTGIKLQPVVGNLESTEARLVNYLDPPHRNKISQPACCARVDIAVDLVKRAPQSLKLSILGSATPFATRGLNVRLFMDRIQDAAARDNQPVPILVAHVLAHEIGHVLARTTAHAPSGLMSASWSDSEYRRLGAGVLLFSRQEAALLRSTLS